ncbi:MAG: hypothetical protein K1X28_05105 [Parachlamydiales bacterium]|nr:hypothetical protein [Parachlamydiales bacterium]
MGSFITFPSASLLSEGNHEYWLKDVYGGDDTVLYEDSHPEYYKENIAARRLIVDALGGDDAVKKIPHAAYPILCSNQYLRRLRCFEETEKVDFPSTIHMSELELIQFPEGTSILQTEDPAGRKALVLRLVDKMNPHRVSVERIFQRFRETCILPGFRGKDGSRWVSKFLSSNGNAAQIAEELRQVVRGTHSRYKLKPAEPAPQFRKSSEYSPSIYDRYGP